MAEKAMEKKPGIGTRIRKFFHDFKVELKKIVWTKPGTAFKNMGIVLVAITLVGLFVFGLDTGLVALLGLFMHV
ncbi:MAG: preprotein translocase subunit SecE [Oscillospiraceae bacterium]|nr:preprotein translocase subunit SecE [Oscillospiraceae bacterium]